MLSLRQFRYIVILAEELHFGRAAERLHIAQPALTQQIKVIEEHLDTRLFARTRRTVRLTEAGALLLSEARAVLKRAERAEQIGRRAGRGELGHIDVGYVSSAAYSGILSQIFYSFRREFPGIDLVFHEMDMEQQLNEIADGRLDVGFIRPPVAEFPDGVSATPIIEERVLIALHDQHPLAKRKTVPINQLAGEPFIGTHLPPTMGFSGTTHAICRDHGFSPIISHRTRQFATIVSLVGAGLGVAMVPASLEHFTLPNVCYRRPEGKLLRSTQIALAHPERERAATIERLIDHINRQFRHTPATACPQGNPRKTSIKSVQATD